MAFSKAHLQQQLAHYPPGTTYWVAYSGGLDSTVLLHALAELRGQSSFSLRAIHADHGLQEKSVDWSSHCAKQCAALDIPLTVCELQLRARKGESLEALARQARYQAFSEIIGEDELLLTAHHADDQVETVFLQLLRGAGVAGLAAMPELTRWHAGWLARPLLDQERTSLEAYANENSLQWIEDASNQDTVFDRNYLRHEILPRLKRRWPGLLRTIPRSARHCAMAAHLLEEQGASLLADETGSNPWQLPIALLDASSVARQQHLLRSWIKHCGLQVPSEAVLKRILSEVVAARTDATPLLAWKEGEVRRYRETLFLMPVLQEVPENWSADWDTNDPLPLPAGLGTLSAKFPQPVVVRFRSEGLRCRLAGQSGTRTLKRIAQDKGVPSWMRNRIPLIFVGDTLLVIGDVAICEGYREQLGEDGDSLVWDREPYLAGF